MSDAATLAFALVGGGAIVLGLAWRYVPSVRALMSGTARKRCPDCAEAVLKEASVCKHCGYHFERPSTTQKPGRVSDEG